MLLIKLWNLLRSVPGLIPGLIDLIQGIKADPDPGQALADLALRLKHRTELEARLRAKKPRKQ
jgi:hypothetical protein